MLTIRFSAYSSIVVGIISLVTCYASDQGIQTCNPAAYVESFHGKPRVFVISDIGNEPDDQMSLTRFLLYSNEFDVEGLVASTSTWQRKKVSPEIMQKVLSNYGKVRDNLLKHTPGFPAVEDLSKMVKAGQPAYGMAA